MHPIFRNKTGMRNLRCFQNVPVCILLLLCFGYDVNCLSGSPSGEHQALAKCPAEKFYRCPPFATCYGYQQYCSKKFKITLDCFPAKLMGNDSALYEYCQDVLEGKEELPDPQCQYACYDKFVDLLQHNCTCDCEDSKDKSQLNLSATTQTPTALNKTDAGNCTCGNETVKPEGQGTSIANSLINTTSAPDHEYPCDCSPWKNTACVFIALFVIAVVAIIIILVQCLKKDAKARFEKQPVNEPDAPNSFKDDSLDLEVKIMRNFRSAAKEDGTFQEHRGLGQSTGLPTDDDVDQNETAV